MSDAKCRSKVILNRVVESDHGPSGKCYDYEFGFVYSDVEGSENKKYWECTPCGEFALRQIESKLNLEPGKEYYLDLIEAN